MQPVHAEIVSIGEELLSSESETLDTNSVYITQQLGSIGVRVLYKSTVGDDEARITDVLRIALRRAQIVITTGGLGPTVDDMTRQAVAAATERTLIFEQALLDEIAEKFARFNARMSANNRIQALLPEGAVVINNPAGTAPGFYVDYDGALILSLPGVPREMKAMMTQTVIPLLRERLGAPRVIKTRILRTAGIGESHIDEQIGHLERLSNPTVGLNAHAGQTDIRVTARTDTEAEAQALIAAVEAEVRAKLGDHIFGVDKETLEQAFADAVAKAGLRVVVGELYTGSAIQRRLSKAHFPEGSIQYADSEVMAVLRDSAEGDLRAVAEHVAAALCAQYNANAALVVIAEADSSAMAVTNGSETRSRAYFYGTDTTAPDVPSGWAISMGWHLFKRLA
ncbi:MAG: CinA family nicotinamide mononucleotide deamidase-related protein [Chloroflexi bacterium CFX4]|nr:CinA family nicotinamide mononucleotide deamidase-related protein [Chloroflexi bacterium CFX4]MDL1921926.1 CinA family nicotinamide mononucleotide deamidase-related protein [Chloroflexi bacterium CFX3]